MGLGVELPDGRFYSSAVVKAMDLEKQAGYPRILIGDRLSRYMAELLSCTVTTAEEAAEQSVLRGAAELIVSDGDGQLMIDFFGPQVRRVSGDQVFSGVLEDAFGFVNSERIRFESTGNRKLGDRYVALAKYLDARKHLWADVIGSAVLAPWATRLR